MTVDELRELLEDVDGDRIVVLSRDEDGGECALLSGGWEGTYFAEAEVFEVEAESDDPDAAPAFVLVPL